MEKNEYYTFKMGLPDQEQYRRSNNGECSFMCSWFFYTVQRDVFSNCLRRHKGGKTIVMDGNFRCKKGLADKKLNGRLIPSPNCPAYVPERKVRELLI